MKYADSINDIRKVNKLPNNILKPFNSFMVG